MNSQIKILAADDSATALNIIEEVFNVLDDNILLFQAKDGKAAVEIAEKELPDLILLDVVMPKMTGLQVTEHLKENPQTKNIPIIILSANNHLEQAFSLGAQDFISKPFKYYELLLRAKQALKLVDQFRQIRVQNIELENQRNALINQRDKLAEQKKELLDDIIYSKRIQNAILPSEKRLNELFSEYFVLDIPKNIVSGDFYWVGQRNNQSIIAVADCTGHGISGAFMTMAGIAFLNEIISRYEFDHPNEVLNLLREKVMKLLKQKGEEGEAFDGMDLALCFINNKTLECEYAGANNPLYIIRGNSLISYRADRMPVGIHVNFDAPFKYHTLQLEKDDVIYLFSDGYPDQFGGPKGKKFRYKQFQELLINVSKKSAKSQKDMLLKTYNKWKGTLEQVDDIMIMGLKIK